jgi:predicted DNA-binding transcriptional regulator AlpA
MQQCTMVLRVSTTILFVARLIDPADLIGIEEVAPIIGLTNPRGVSVYRRRHADFPEPVVDRNLCVLWLRADIEAWAKGRA